MKRLWIFGTVLFLIVALPASAQTGGNEAKKTPQDLEQENARLRTEMENLKLDRNNVLKQAQVLQKEKADLVAKLEAASSTTNGAAVEIESLKKENTVLKTEAEKLKAARAKDRELHTEEKTAMEQKLKEEEDRSASLAKSLEAYTPEKVSTLVEDRNRLEAENKRLAERLLEVEKKMAEIQKNLTPLELDRQELHKIQAENKELRNRTKYQQKMEARLAQLIKENKEYREQLEILKGKFKDAVPGLAKSGRIAQKMMRENAQMHYNLGTIFLQNKRYKEAIGEYEKVLELMPNDPDTHYNLGVLYDDFLKDREKALYHYQKYIAVNPKAPDAKRVETYILNLELEEKVR